MILRARPWFSQGHVGHDRWMRFRPWFLVPTALYLWWVASITLGSSPYGASGEGLLSQGLDFAAGHSATAWLTFGVVERLANVALFVPLGFLGALAFPRRFWVVPFLLCVSLSCGIETFQGAFLPTRVEDFHDVISNGLGALVGALAVTVVRMLVSSRPSGPTSGVASPAAPLTSAKLDRLPSNGRG